MPTDELNQQYLALRTAVKEQGLTKRMYLHYVVSAAVILSLLSLSVFIITKTDSVWIQAVNAILFTFSVMQIAFLGHDFSHGQVFESSRLNRFFGLVVWGLALGGSESVWFEEHNMHHEHVNQDGADPDLNIPFLFRDGQRAGTFSFTPWLVRHQHLIFFISLPVWYTSKLLRTWVAAVERLPAPRVVAECALAVLHFVVLFYFVFSHLSLITGLVFLAIHVLSTGFYMGFAFAPNHKGEEVVSQDAEVTWLNQITSTRNLYPSFLSFQILGGLSLQIEHHLFPGVSRYQYPKIQKLVQTFCRENNIRYHQTTWFGSMKEIYTALKTEAVRR